MASCGVLRRNGVAFDADHMRLYGALVPHLRRALELTVRNTELDLARRRAEAAADAGAEGMVVVDAQRRILFINSAAKATLNRGTALRCQSGRLQVVDPSERGRFARLVKDAANRRSFHGGSIRLGRLSSSALAAVVTPLPPDVRGGAGSDESSALVTLIDLTPRPPVSAAGIGRVFGLTKAEAELALALVDGSSMEEIAVSRQIDLSILHQQLAALAIKTGARRRSDLVRLLSRIAPQALSGKP